MSSETEAISHGIGKLRKMSAEQQLLKHHHHKVRLEEPDDVLKLVGSPGRFHYLQFVGLCLQFIPLVMSDLIPIFYNLKPQQVICQDGNLTTAYDYDLHNSEDSYCGCNGSLLFIYNGRQTSIVGEMSLVCERKFLADLATTLYYLGCAVAGPLMGWLSDTHGRRPVLLFSSLAFCGLLTSYVFVNNYVLFACIRFLTGVARVGVFSTSYVLLMEWAPPSRRNIVAAASEFFFPLGVMILASSAFYLQNWRYIQIALAGASAVTSLNIWFGLESLQFLVTKGKVVQTISTIRKIAEINNHKVHQEALNSLDAFSDKIAREHAALRKASILDCFRHRTICKYTLLISFVWFATNFGYSGLSYLMDSLSDNIYMDLTIGGALELIPCVLTTLIVIKIGKKLPMICFMFFGGVLTLLAGTLAFQSEMKIYLALLGRMSFVGSYCLMFLYAAELFPTNIRNSGFGVGFIFFMCGGILSPQLSMLSGLLSSADISSVILGSVALAGAVAVGFLPGNAEPASHEFEA